MSSTKTWSDVCGIVAGALALSGSVGIFGIELPLATMPHAAGRLADTLLQVSDSFGDFPGASGRLSQIISFLQSASQGMLAYLALALSAIHIAVCAGAIILACLNLLREHRTWRAVLAGALVMADAGSIMLLCSVISWQLFLIVRSTARGNPWAVGRGIAGLDPTLSPSLGLIVAAIAGIATIILALAARHAKTRTPQARPDEPTV